MAETAQNGSRAQTMTLLVAVIGIVGSVVTVIVGDQREDDRRIKVERRQTYREYAQVTKDFEEIYVFDMLQKLSAVRSAIQAYQKDPLNAAVVSTVTSAYSDNARAWEQQRSSYRDVNAKYDDIRLIGSSSAIEAAGELNDAVRRRYNYLAGYSRLLSGEARSVNFSEVDQFMKSKKSFPLRRRFGMSIMSIGLS